MLVFGSLGATADKLTVQGWLYDVRTPLRRRCWEKQYSDAANEAAARLTAHKFADEIILRLGGGIPGIAEQPNLNFVSDRTGAQGNLGMATTGSRPATQICTSFNCLSPRISHK